MMRKHSEKFFFRRRSVASVKFGGKALPPSDTEGAEFRRGIFPLLRKRQEQVNHASSRHRYRRLWN